MAIIDPERAKKLGKLMQDARDHRERTLEECARVLALTDKAYEQAEAGEHPVSLPQLEALAIYLRIPMGYFWGSASLPQEAEVDFDDMLTLRNRVIGVLLNQLRLRAGRSRAEVAEHLALDEALIETYELGETAVPFLHLEQLCHYLDGSVNLFLEEAHGPLARHEAQYQLLKQFEEMTPEMRLFLTNPVNISYLETAKKLSEMNVSKLRQIAEDILEITY